MALCWKFRAKCVGMSELSAYELERQRTITKNNEKLRELGLDAPAPAVRRALPAKRPKPQHKPPVDSAPLRRSTRQRTSVPVYTEVSELPVERRRPARARPYEAPDDDASGDDDEAGASSPSGPLLAQAAEGDETDERPPPEKGTARATAVSVGPFVEAHLGSHIDGPPTKYTVMCALNGGTPVRFSKYAGSLEMRNALVLWVNIGGADYKNVFTDGGRQMTWYASPRQNEATPIVRRMLACRGERDAGGKKAGDEAVLFCRLPGDPYVCCGRLRYRSHVPKQQPLKFMWELLDIEKLRASEHFTDLLRVAGR